VAAYVTACVDRPRSLATSRRTAFGLRVAGRRPGLADRLVLASLRRLDRPAPSFVRQWSSAASSSAASSRSTPGNTNQKNTVVAASTPEATPANTPPYTTVDTR